MFTDSSFVIALSFVVFCIVLYRMYGSAFLSYLDEIVDQRQQLERRMTEECVTVEQEWQVARQRMEQLPYEIESVRRHYASLKEHHLAQARLKEERWHSIHQQEEAARMSYHRRCANELVVEDMIGEFVHAPERL